MKISKAGTGIIAATALIAIAACSSPGGSGTATTSASPSVSAVSPAGTSAPLEITIKDFAYQGPVSVSPGAKVTVINKDAQAHTVTADDGNAFEAIVKGDPVEFTAPTKPGSYSYHCAYHSNMKGILVVK